RVAGGGLCHGRGAARTGGRRQEEGRSRGGRGFRGVNARPLTAAKRVVVKIGSALLVDETSGGIRRRWLEALADDVAALRSEGKDVILVSSGAIAVGRRHLDLPEGPLRLEEKQA